VTSAICACHDYGGQRSKGGGHTFTRMLSAKVSAYLQYHS